MTQRIEPSENIIAASPNCLYGYSTWVAYAEFPKLGIRYTELPAFPSGLGGGIVPEVMDEDDITRLKERFAKLDITPISVGAYCDLQYPKQVDALKVRIAFAQKLGVKTVISDATRQLEVDAEQWRRIVNILRYLGDYAADHGVRIALETHGGITRNGALCRKLLDAVDHAAIGVNYDTGNIYYYNEGMDPENDVRHVADRVVQVHLKDTTGGLREWKFCALGQGRVNFPAVIEVLQAAGFKGPYSMELEGSAGEDLNKAGHVATIKKSLDYLREIGLMAPQAG